MSRCRDLRSSATMMTGRVRRYVGGMHVSSILID